MWQEPSRLNTPHLGALSLLFRASLTPFNRSRRPCAGRGGRSRFRRRPQARNERCQPDQSLCGSTCRVEDRPQFRQRIIKHVVHDDMADVALAISESARLPYLQTVSRFGTVARGLRLSRRWCRGLVATSPDLAQELVDDLGVPDDRIAVIPPGLVLNPAPSRTASAAARRRI